MSHNDELIQYITRLLKNTEKQIQTEVIPFDLNSVIYRLTRRINAISRPYAPPSVADTLTEFGVELRSEKVTYKRANEMLLLLKDIAYITPKTAFSANPISRSHNTTEQESELESRLTRIEIALAKARSNPAVEKKISQIEEDLKKIVTTTVQAEEKEQEDLIKKYKSAKKKAFAIMPFNPAFDDIWVGGIDRACATEGFCCIRVDKISTSTWINDDIEECINAADVVITDITGNNPNVMFELGWALAKGKKPIIIRQKDDNQIVPFDIQNYRHIKYIDSWSGVESLCKQISKFIKSTSDQKENKT